MNCHRIAIAAAAMTLALGLTASAGELQTTSGTMQLGGVTTFDIDMYMPEEGSNKTGYKIIATPSFGYFISDNLELNGSIQLGTFFGDLYDGFGTVLGFNVGGRYLIDMDSFYLHLGAQIGMLINMPDEGDNTKTLVIGVPIGLLFPLNQHVALDAGLRVNFNMGLDDQGNMLNVPIGYLGVQAFF